MYRLLAFAMSGARAWQARIIIKVIICWLREGDGTGFFRLFLPGGGGVLPVWVCVCVIFSYITHTATSLKAIRTINCSRTPNHSCNTRVLHQHQYISGD